MMTVCRSCSWVYVYVCYCLFICYHEAYTVFFPKVDGSEKSLLIGEVSFCCCSVVSQACLLAVTAALPYWTHALLALPCTQLTRLQLLQIHVSCHKAMEDRLSQAHCVSAYRLLKTASSPLCTQYAVYSTRYREKRELLTQGEWLCPHTHFYMPSGGVCPSATHKCPTQCWCWWHPVPVPLMQRATQAAANRWPCSASDRWRC